MPKHNGSELALWAEVAKHAHLNHSGDALRALAALADAQVARLTPKIDPAPVPVVEVKASPAAPKAS